jgi:hypothetical protein
MPNSDKQGQSTMRLDESLKSLKILCDTVSYSTWPSLKSIAEDVKKTSGTSKSTKDDISQAIKSSNRLELCKALAEALSQPPPHSKKSHGHKMKRSSSPSKRRSSSASKGSMKNTDNPCWDGYKVGNPKTKISKRSGKRVNNCIKDTD